METSSMDQIASFQTSLVSTPLPTLQDPLHLPTILDRGCQASKTQGSTLLQQSTWDSITSHQGLYLWQITLIHLFQETLRHP